MMLSQSGEKVARAAAEMLGAELHGREGRTGTADAHFPDALAHARDLFAAGVPIVGVCASGILIRAVAPLLGDKRSEPPVVSVSDDGAVIVPLLGGHRGANRIARRLAEGLGGVPAVTTAGDIALGTALDAPPPGWSLDDPGTPAGARPVMAALLGGGARITGAAAGTATWLKDVPEGDAAELCCTMAASLPPATLPRLVYRPQRAALGVGCSRNCPPEELIGLVDELLAEADIAPGAIAAVHTLDLKEDEPAMHALAAHLGAPLRFFTADALEAEAGRLATPSQVVFDEVGCHGVCEGAALAGAGGSGELVMPKRRSAMATAALALAPEPITEPGGRPRGRLSVVGIGPGQAAWRTPEVSRLVAQADILVGYGLYIDLLGPLAAGKERHDFPLGGEEARCRHALELAGQGHSVALVCSGDAGIYAMGALVFELLDRAEAEGGVGPAARRAEIVCSPGVSALQAAAAQAGAPLGHDFCAISLSDLLTPREDIVRRLEAAAQGDFVIAFYNPVSKRRRTLLAEARDILLRHRPADTPVLLASSLGRPEEALVYRRLDALDVDEVDMLTVVLVGSSQTRLAQLGEGPRMYTPRGYARRIDGDLSGR
ncbi:precorrin-3B C(17)-methyltransferase [Profundibacterium mesophilum]|nr:precorrin-3B C(17)-methyltransferase [Profundibacterium mesophilum]